MYTILIKELQGFFSSLSGYIVILVFLLANGLFFWVFPGEMNILDTGYANLNTLFEMAPWIFLFLVPAVCMRLFADERRSGTMELLLTRPVSDFHIVCAKYLSALLVVLFSLLPTLIYLLSVYYLGSPNGSVDLGATWGSYIGLFLLGAVYSAIGVFASSFTENQVVAFLLALVLCFIFYVGFDYVSELEGVRGIQNQLILCGIQEHYRSISRGILDSRDVVYFFSVISVFLLLCQTVLKSRKW